jgi:hypothetical protein
MTTPLLKEVAALTNKPADKSPAAESVNASNAVEHKLSDSSATKDSSVLGGTGKMKELRERAKLRRQLVAQQVSRLAGASLIATSVYYASVYASHL